MNLTVIRIKFPSVVYIKDTSANHHELNMLICVAFWWPSDHQFAYVDVISGAESIIKSPILLFLANKTFWRALPVIQHIHPCPSKTMIVILGTKKVQC
jgi:hypothetical protein